LCKWVGANEKRVDGKMTELLEKTKTIPIDQPQKKKKKKKKKKLNSFRGRSKGGPKKKFKN